MIKVLVVAALVATPFIAHSAFAKNATPAVEEHTGPVAYADLAAIDAKMNMPMKATKRHMHHKVVHKATAATATTTAPAPAK